MTVLTTAQGQADLPRYFAQVLRVLERLQAGRLDFVLPDGRRFRAEGSAPGPQAEIIVRNPDVFARLIREGDLGFSDAYVEGEWDTPDLQAFMDLVQQPANNAVNDGFPGMGLIRAYERMRHWMRGNSRRQARKNISFHYDLGNDFYALWLDRTMTYSSALFRDPRESLEAAQIAKYASMVDRIGAQPGDHLLEIGCGWGGFAEYAAGQRGLRLTCLTISQEQHDYAQARMQRAGLSDRVQIRMQDYRDEQGQYDGIASIEMFEAVGEQYWPAYFATLRDCLKPGRNAVLQIITVPDHRFETYRRGVDFIQKYIFPGGMLPSPRALQHEVAQAGLRLAGSLEFGESYSQTLRRWYAGFNAHWPEVRALGFDDRFRRMWNFYLTSCAGAFQGGNCDVTQVTVTRPA
ncbi:SAM-dependent methyltransferase [Gemmobacter serpentinus]|uniref:SAM-dependent methyltransferase n=1 Tax=Gemmobacter serpentinus TaxID=2652247 RepID=UPI00124D4EA0|nr:cyclopropane-fatty-acyl-phospholipid synthase family protein [Gemmobacter serpentinus]